MTIISYILGVLSGIALIGFALDDYVKKIGFMNLYEWYKRGGR